MGIGSIIKAKVLALILAGVAVTGGATVVLAATPLGQQVVHNFTGASANSDNATKTPDADSGDHGKNCTGDTDAANLAKEFTLSTDSKSDAMQAICDLHTGNFAGKSADGSAVTSKRVYGYGEIEKLLIYAQYLAGQDKANTSGKLTDDNTRTYLSEALHNCGSTPLEKCLMDNIPGFHPGNGNGNGSGNGSGSGNGNGKPEGTPTPHH